MQKNRFLLECGRNEIQNWNCCYGTEELPLFPVYAGCYCTVESVEFPEEGESYYPERVNLKSSNEDYANLQLIYGEIRDIPELTVGQSLEPDDIIGYLPVGYTDTDSQGNEYFKFQGHLHLEIRRRSDNSFVNPFPYLSPELQEQMLAFEGNVTQTTYREGFPNSPLDQPSGFYGQPAPILPSPPDLPQNPKYFPL